MADALRKFLILLNTNNFIWVDQDHRKSNNRYQDLGDDRAKYAKVFFLDENGQEEELVGLARKIAPLIDHIYSTQYEEELARLEEENPRGHYKTTDEDLNTHVSITFETHTIKKQEFVRFNAGKIPLQLPDVLSEAINKKIGNRKLQSRERIAIIRDLLSSSSFDETCEYFQIPWPDNVNYVEEIILNRPRNTSVRSLLIRTPADDEYHLYRRSSIFECFHFSPCHVGHHNRYELYLFRSIFTLLPPIVIGGIGGEDAGSFNAHLCKYRVPNIQNMFLGGQIEGGLPYFEYLGRLKVVDRRQLFFVLEKRRTRGYQDLCMINATVVNNIDGLKLRGFYNTVGQGVEGEHSKIQHSAPILIRRLMFSNTYYWKEEEHKEMVMGWIRRGPIALRSPEEFKSYFAKNMKTREEFNRYVDDHKDNNKGTEFIPYTIDPLKREEFKELLNIQVVERDDAAHKIQDAVKVWNPTLKELFDV